MPWLMGCVDVPIECTACGALTTIGGLENDPSPELGSDLCGCDAEYRVYISDAPAEHRQRLAMLLDLLQASGQADIMTEDPETNGNAERDGGGTA